MPTGDLRLAVLGSGSRGNAVVIESSGRRLLVDAGFTCKQLETRMSGLGLGISDLEAVVLTHEHQDHTKGVELLARRHGIPIFATLGTLEGLKLSNVAAGQAQAIRSGWPFEIAGFSVEAFSLPHDAREPVGFVIEDPTGRRVGLAADLGARSQLAWARLKDLDVLVLETNHDLTMLREGPYPWSLKQRVAGRFGHLSNREAAEGLYELLDTEGGERLDLVVLYHLSQKNNLPALATQALGEVLDRTGSGARLELTSQDRASAWLESRQGRSP